MSIAEQVQKRRAFAIISHPDAGKTTLTEKLLLFGGAIQLAGAVKARAALEERRDHARTRDDEWARRARPGQPTSQLPQAPARARPRPFPTPAA